MSPGIDPGFYISLTANSISYWAIIGGKIDFDDYQSLLRYTCITKSLLINIYQKLRTHAGVGHMILRNYSRLV